MNRLHYLVLAGTALLFCVLYFVFDTVPPQQAGLEKSRELTAEQTGIDVLLAEARQAIDPQSQRQIVSLENELDAALPDSSRHRLQEQLSRSWYAAGQPAIAGYYAQVLAESVNTAESWAIAGTTYGICVQQAAAGSKKDFCTGRAITCLENAISLQPGNVDHQVNLALIYTSNPPANEPMKGVLQLRELQAKYPESTVVLNALGRLAIQTGQYARAIERLQQALVLEENNRNTICLLATAYEGAGNQEQGAIFARRCRE